MLFTLIVAGIVSVLNLLKRPAGKHRRTDPATTVPSRKETLAPTSKKVQKWPLQIAPEPMTVEEAAYLHQLDIAIKITEQIARPPEDPDKDWWSWVYQQLEEQVLPCFEGVRNVYPRSEVFKLAIIHRTLPQVLEGIAAQVRASIPAM